MLKCKWASPDLNFIQCVHIFAVDGVLRVSPYINMQPGAYLACMKNHKIAIGAAMSALALSFLLVGCAREISSEKHSTVSSNGTVKTKEKTVTQSYEIGRASCRERV